MLVKVASGVFIQEGRKGEQFPCLPAGMFEWVPPNPMDGSPAFFSPLPTPHVPSKIYGNPTAYAERYLKTFISRENFNTGVALAGEKGSGKSMLMNEVARLGIEAGYPVIIISQPFTQAMFSTLLRMANTRCIVVIDEYEKKFNPDNSNEHELLTVLEGSDIRGHMFLLAMNQKRVSEYLVNRPNRVHYTKQYAALPREVMKEYLEDILTNKEHIEKFEILYDHMVMNFDVMQNLVAELNRYPGLSFKEIVKDMGLTLELSGNTKFLEVTSVLYNGVELLIKPSPQMLRLSALRKGDVRLSNIDVDAKKLVETILSQGTKLRDSDTWGGKLQNLPITWDDNSCTNFGMYWDDQTPEMFKAASAELRMAMRFNTGTYSCEDVGDGVYALTANCTAADIKVVMEESYREDTIDSIFG